MWIQQAFAEKRVEIEARTDQLFITWKPWLQWLKKKMSTPVVILIQMELASPGNQIPGGNQ